MTTKQKKDALYALCQKFIKKQQISSPESVHQCDWVIENAYDFIEGVCDIVGYHKEYGDNKEGEGL